MAMTRPERVHAIFYVTQHSQTMSHSEFQGPTPDEICFGCGADVLDELAGAQACRAAGTLGHQPLRVALLLTVTGRALEGT